MLDAKELWELEDNLKKELEDRLTEILTLLNRSGQLEQLLDLMGLANLLHPDNGYKPYPKGKIIVVGASQVKEKVLLSVGESLGISKDRFELYLDYDKAKTFNFKKMQYSPCYSLIMVGPMPHSGIEKAGAGSIIAAIEHEAGYPPVVRLGNSGLKITKSDFKFKLKESLDSGKITA